MKRTAIVFAASALFSVLTSIAQQQPPKPPAPALLKHRVPAAPHAPRLIKYVTPPPTPPAQSAPKIVPPPPPNDTGI